MVVLGYSAPDTGRTLSRCLETGCSYWGERVAKIGRLSEKREEEEEEDTEKV